MTFRHAPKEETKVKGKKKAAKSGTGGERGDRLLPWTLKERLGRANYICDY